MKNQQAKKAAKIMLQMKGVIDCMAGKPAICRNKHYTNGYGKQYEIEAVISGRSLEVML